MKSFFSLFVRFVLLLVILLKVGLVMGQELAAARGKAETNDPRKVIGTSLVFEQGHATSIAESKKAVVNHPAQPTTLSNTTETKRLKLWVAHKALSTKKVLGFTLKQHGNYKLEVLNMHGTIVAVLADDFGQEGEELTFQFKGDNLPAGTYIGRLVTDGEVTSTRFVLQ